MGTTMTQPIDVERATELYREWLLALKKEASLATINQSQAMMRAVMVQLRKALTPEQVLKVANALPALPRGIFIEGWSLDETREIPASADAFFQGVHAQIHQHHAPPRSIVRDAFAVWRHFLPTRDARTIWACLPEALKPLWPA
jgi:uncharacterized protein (DUF2267 family)